MLNKVIIMGRMARTPEIRHTQSGATVASFTLACDRDFKDKNTGQKETDWIDCIAWNGNADFVQKYVVKGQQIVVDGRLQVRDWTDRDGNKRRTSEVVVNNVYFAGPNPDRTEPGYTPEQDDFPELDDNEEFPF